MFCELCSLRGQHIRRLQKQHWEMLQKIDANYVDSKMAGKWICATCEYNLEEKFVLQLQSEAYEEKFKMQYENQNLKEILKTFQNNLKKHQQKSCCYFSSSVNGFKVKSESYSSDAALPATNTFQVLSDNLKLQRCQIKQTKMKRTGYNGANRKLNPTSKNIKENIFATEFSLSQLTYSMNCNESSKEFISETMNSVESTATALRLQYSLKFKTAMQNSGKSYRCKLCDKSKIFSQPTALRQHIKFKHFNIGFKCHECNTNSKSSAILRKHYLQQHGRKGPFKLHNFLLANHKKYSQFITETARKAKNLTKSKVKSRCRTTQIHYKRLYNKECLDFSNHYKIVNNNYLCQICSQPFEYTTSVGVLRHIQFIHYGFRFECTVCNRKFMDHGTIRKHYKRIHQIEGPTQIKPSKNYELVQKTYDTKLEPLPQTFERIDSNCYECTMCSESKKYSSVQNVRHHIKLHHYGYRFSCSDCNLQYTQVKTLKTHLRKCHNKKADGPFKLELPTQLQESPKKKQSLQEMDNSKYYDCTICSEPRQYSSRHYLQIHIKVHHYGYRYVCSECDKAYRDPISLKVHYKKLHNMENGSVSLELPKNCSNSDGQRRSQEKFCEIDVKQEEITFSEYSISYPMFPDVTGSDDGSRDLYLPSVVNGY